jgi:hypothetical protein
MRTGDLARNHVLVNAAFTTAPSLVGSIKEGLPQASLTL